ncbi:hypothetical protein OV207_19560 [Corallococcus sp. BB11-1]|nr:hypothetical protein [Corallococcus sp. BB11-1]
MAGAYLRAESPGPSWSASRWRHGAELELSDARATVPRWSCPTWATSGPSGSCPLTRHGAELELSGARTTRPRWSCRTYAPRAELELSDARHGAELELPGAPELRLSERAPRCPSWAR